MKLLTLIFCYISSAYAEIEYMGQLSMEARAFKDDHNSVTEDYGSALFGRLELRDEDRDWMKVLRGFFRVDLFDHSREIFVLEDAYVKKYLGEQENWNVLAGYKIFNWTATEAFHPADQVNSRNFDSALENLEKIGELTLELNRVLWEGEISFYLWPRYEKPYIPGRRSRLGVGVSINEYEFVDSSPSDGQWGVQGGFKFSQSLDSMDFSVHYLHHMDRNLPFAGYSQYTYNSMASSYIPLSKFSYHYFMVDQLGATLQYVLGSQVFKLEAAARFFSESKEILTTAGVRGPKDHQETALGWEYSLAHGSSQSYFFVEANFVTGVNKNERALLNPFQQDVFLGYRYAHNDVDGKELTLGFIFDLERSHEYFASVLYSQRINNEWKISGSLRYYDAPVKGPSAAGLEVLDDDGQLSLTLARHF